MDIDDAVRLTQTGSPMMRDAIFQCRLAALLWHTGDPKISLEHLQRLLDRTAEVQAVEVHND